MPKLLLVGSAHEHLPVGSHSKAVVIPLHPCYIPPGEGQRAAEASGGAAWDTPARSPPGRHALQMPHKQGRPLCVFKE